MLAMRTVPSMLLFIFNSANNWSILIRMKPLVPCRCTEICKYEEAFLAGLWSNEPHTRYAPSAFHTPLNYCRRTSSQQSSIWSSTHPGFYGGGQDLAESEKVLRAALDSGITLINTADFYTGVAEGDEVSSLPTRPLERSMYLQSSEQVQRSPFHGQQIAASCMQVHQISKPTFDHLPPDGWVYVINVNISSFFAGECQYKADRYLHPLPSCIPFRMWP